MSTLHIPDGSRGSHLSPVELSPEITERVLRDGELELLGRMAWSSNATFLVTASLDGIDVSAVYKPRRGERPLWDFADGTLCEREVATYELSEILGWGLIPTTVLRDGPYGVGMVQRFVDHDPEDHYFTLLETHADVMRQFAVFDVLANNADRKGGHCLLERGTDDIWGIDHGLTFHEESKLRTVIWDFAGEEIADAMCADFEALVADLDGPRCEELSGLLAPNEIEALRARSVGLMRMKSLPIPNEGYKSVPWPLI